MAIIISSTSSRDEARLISPSPSVSREKEFLLLPFVLETLVVGDENVGNGGYVKDDEPDVVVVVAIIVDNKLLDLATARVEVPPIGISTDNEDNEPPFFFFFFFPFSTPLPPTNALSLPSFASCNSFSSCLRFKAFKLDSKDIPTVPSILGKPAKRDFTIEAVIVVVSCFSCQCNHSSGGSSRFFKFMKKTKE